MSRRQTIKEAIRIDLHLQGDVAALVDAEAKRSGSPKSEVIRQAIRIAYGDPDHLKTPDPDQTDPDHPKPSDPDQLAKSDPDQLAKSDPDHPDPDQKSDPDHFQTRTDPDQSRPKGDPDHSPISDEELAALFN